jgi:glutamate racemase
LTPNSQAAPIGVFDSGIGGLSILRALREELPHEHFVYIADSAFAPYGERDDRQVIARSLVLTRALHEQHSAKAVVMACNTATAAAVREVRAALPDLPIVGVEPALKPAVETSHTQRIGVLATRGTLASAKFAELHATLAHKATFVLQPCDGLADAIEVLSRTGDATKVIALSAEYTRIIGQFGSNTDRIDTLVLGCTHYPLVADILQSAAGDGVRLIDTGVPVARQTRRLLAAAHLLRTEAASPGEVRLFATGDTAALQAAAARWLGLPGAWVANLAA